MKNLLSAVRRNWRARCRQGLRRHRRVKLITAVNLRSISFKDGMISFEGVINDSHDACAWCGRRIA